MLKKPRWGLFVTGNDTEVGKTYVASIIVRSLVADGYRVGVYKPTASGCVPDGPTLMSGDAYDLWTAAGQPLDMDAVCPQRFRAPLAPHLAAAAEGVPLDSDLLRTGISRWTDACDIVVVEGAGGLMTPLSETEYVADLALDFDYPLVVVTRNILGAINQTLQTLICAACFRDGLDVAGVVLNDLQAFARDQSIDSNEREIAARSSSPLLGRIHYQQDHFDPPVDWMMLARRESDHLSDGLPEWDD